MAPRRLKPTGLVASLGKVLRRRREELGYSQEQLAELAGLHRTYIGSVERGERNLSLLNLEALSTALRLSASELLRQAEARMKTE